MRVNLPQHSLFTWLPPLSDQAAASILEFLHELLYQFESTYIGQIRRYREHEGDVPAAVNQLDLFHNPDDPPF